MRLLTALACWIALSLPAAPANGRDSRHVPTIDELLAIRGIGTSQISPNGAFVAYTVIESDFSADEFVTQLWIARTSDGVTYQLTRGNKSARLPRWSPDGRWLAFESARNSDKVQLHLIRPDGGEATLLTKLETDVEDYTWSPDSLTIAFVGWEQD